MTRLLGAIDGVVLPTVVDLPPEVDLGEVLDAPPPSVQQADVHVSITIHTRPGPGPLENRIHLSFRPPV